MKYIGNLTITRDNCENFADLTQVTGWLYVREGATLSAPALAYVGGLPVATPKDAAANLKIIAPLALKKGALNMGEVHTCDTQHCMAGWACHAIPGGGALEQKHGWNAAGFHFLGLEAGKMFYTDTDTARKFLLQFI